MARQDDRQRSVIVHIAPWSSTCNRSQKMVVALCGASEQGFFVFKDEVGRNVNCEACILLHWKETGEEG